MSGGLETLPSRPFSGNSAALNSYCIPSVSPRPSRIVTNPPLRASPFVRSHREKEQQPLRRVSPKTAARMYSPVRTHARSRESPTPRRGKHVDAKGRYETTPRHPNRGATSCIRFCYNWMPQPRRTAAARASRRVHVKDGRENASFLRDAESAP